MIKILIYNNINILNLSIMKQFEHYLKKMRNKVNESIDTNKLNDHVLAFFIKYGKNYYNNDASILEFLQNNDEDHTDEESQNQLKEALKNAMSTYESTNRAPINIGDKVRFDDLSDNGFMRKRYGFVKSINNQYSYYEIEVLDGKKVKVAFNSAIKVRIDESKINKNNDKPMKQFEHYLNKVQNKKVNELRNVTVKYSDGSEINTDMASHLTDAEIRDYYKIGKQFNLGNAPVKDDGNYGDNVQTVTDVVINEAVNNVELTYLRQDEDTGNFIYGDNDNNKYVSVDGVIHTLTDYGEPNYPIANAIVKKGEPVYNPADRFGRNVGSKIQEAVNMMALTIPPVEQWVENDNIGIKHEIGIKNFDKTYFIRSKDVEMLKANVGKMVKFRYDSDEKPMYMEFVSLVESKMSESVASEAKYKVYHNLYSEAVSEALEYAEKSGYTYDKEETAQKIGLGNPKPKDGKTNKFTITLFKDGKESKKALHIQIYGMGEKYELNAYIN